MTNRPTFVSKINRIQIKNHPQYLTYFTLLLLKRCGQRFCHVKIIKSEFSLLKMPVTINFALCMCYAD